MLSRSNIGDPQPAIAIRVKTPDGTMIVVFEEDDAGRINRLQIILGKSGSAIAAWASAFASSLNVALKNKTNLTEILEAISGATSDKLAFTSEKKIPVRSGPEGVAVAMLQYVQHKADEIRDKHVIFRGYPNI